MSATTTSPTAEELAAKLDKSATFFVKEPWPNHSPVTAGEFTDAAAMIRAQAAQIAEVTAERDELRERVTELEAALVPAYDGGVDHAFEVAREAAAGELAAAQERERALREALTGVIGMAENFLELHMMSNAKKDPDIIRARAAMQTKEDGNDR